MARTFNGSTDQIDYGANVATPSAALTVAGWVNPSSFGQTYQCPFGRIASGGGTQGGWAIYLKSTARAAYYLNTTGGGGNQSVDPGTASLNLNTWTHVGFTYSNGDQIMRPYVNGVADGTSSGTGGNIKTTFDSDTFLAHDAQTAGRNFTGSLADWAAWSIQLTVNEMLALANGARPNTIRPASLIFWTPVDGLQSPEPDLGGSHNNGTLAGTSLAASGPPVMMFTPRIPLIMPRVNVAPSFQPAWAMRNRIIVEGIGI